MSKERTAPRSGLGFISVLTLIFITLKLCGVIHWSWIWVLSPIWISAAILLFVFFAILLFLLFCTVMAYLFNK